VSSYPDGYKIHYYACCIAEIAAESKAGGVLLLNQGAGAAMTAPDIAARLGCDFGWLANVLFPALDHLGEGRNQEEGWLCTSPMFTSHTLGWQGGEKAGQKALPSPGNNNKAGRKKIFSGLDQGDKGYEAIYKKWQRTCQLPPGVKLAGACPKIQKGPHGGCLILSGNVRICPNMSGNNKQTGESQCTENADFSECPEIAKEKEVEFKKESPPPAGGGGGPDLENLKNLLLAEYPDRQELIDKAVKATYGRDDITSLFGYCCKRIETSLAKEQKEAQGEAAKAVATAEAIAGKARREEKENREAAIDAALARISDSDLERLKVGAVEGLKLEFPGVPDEYLIVTPKIKELYAAGFLRQGPS
jgi:hypothetical protein